MGAQLLDHTEPSRHIGARLARHRLGPQLRQPPGAELGKARVDVRGDGQAQDAVSQEREPLIRLAAVVDPRGVRERLADEIVRKLIEECLQALSLCAQDAVSGACAAT
jgi:hypothetical protein